MPDPVAGGDRIRARGRGSADREGTWRLWLAIGDLRAPACSIWSGSAPLPRPFGQIALRDSRRWVARGTDAGEGVLCPGPDEALYVETWLVAASLLQGLHRCGSITEGERLTSTRGGGRRLGCGTGNRPSPRREVGPPVHPAVLLHHLEVADWLRFLGRKAAGHRAEIGPAAPAARRARPCPLRNNRRERRPGGPRACADRTSRLAGGIFADRVIIRVRFAVEQQLGKIHRLPRPRID